MSDTAALSVVLDADPRNVGRARTMLPDVVMSSGAEHLVEPATLLVSEAVTNAFVHVGSLSWSGLG